MKRTLSPARRKELLSILEARFSAFPHRHQGLDWSDVFSRLEAHPAKLWSLGEMDQSGGEPAVIGHDEATGEILFADCSAESPTGRRSLCYDREGLDSRKEHKPEHNAVDLAAAMGIELLTEEDYRVLQTLGEFDLKTSSWLQTPREIRVLGGAIFGDRRFGRVFIYHNGAQSFYAARGFRGMLRV